MLGENVKHLRTEANLTQEALAELVGVQQTFIGQIERGEKNPSVRILMKLAAALNVSADVLLNDKISASAISFQE